jgi:hypothetical protein
VAETDWTKGLTGAGWGTDLTATGYGVGALAQLAQGIAAKKRASAASEYNQKVVQANAQAQAQADAMTALQYERQAAVARQDMLLSQQAQAYREGRQQDVDARVLANTRAIVGASGLMMTGSPLAVEEETIRQQELDILAGRYTAQLQQRAAEDQAVQAEYAAKLARYGMGERLRIGRQQAGAIRAETDTSQVMAGLLRAGSTVTQGASKYAESQASVPRSTRIPRTGFEFLSN